MSKARILASCGSDGALLVGIDGLRCWGAGTRLSLWLKRHKRDVKFAPALSPKTRQWSTWLDWRYDVGMDGREHQHLTIDSAQAEAFEIVGGDAGAGIVILCDHASNALPPEYGTLQLDPAELDRHIAYDIGAESVTRLLAAELKAPAVLAQFSRLLIDPNRGIDDPTLIMRISDGAVIEGNRNLDDAERQQRLTRFHTPYHDAIANVIGAHRRLGITPLLLSIHSFTPIWKGSRRPWHAALLWDQDPRLAQPMLTSLRALGHCVGDNEPYSGDLHGDTLWRHGTTNGLVHAIVEIRQDLIEGVPGQTKWASTLATVIQNLLTDHSKSSSLRRNL